MKNIIIEKGVLKIELQAILEYLDEETTGELFKIAAFRETLADFVMGHILEDGCYDGWYIGDLGQKLRMRLIPMMDDVAKAAIKSLIIKVRQVESAADQQGKYAHAMSGFARNVRDAAHDALLNGGNEARELAERLKEAPKRPKYEPVSYEVSDDEITAVMLGKKRI